MNTAMSNKGERGKNLMLQKEEAKEAMQDKMIGKLQRGPKQAALKMVQIKSQALDDPANVIYSNSNVVEMGLQIH